MIGVICYLKIKEKNVDGIFEVFAEFLELFDFVCKFLLLAILIGYSFGYS